MSSEHRPLALPRVLLAGSDLDPLVVVRSGTWRYNSIGFFHGEEACLVDPGLSPQEIAMTVSLVVARRGAPRRRLAHLVLTHSHHDHLRGAGLAGEAHTWMPRTAAEKGPAARARIQAAGEKLGRRLLAHPPGFPWPEPQETFEDAAQFDLGGGERVELLFLPGHSNCTSVVLLPRLATLCCADYLVSPGVPFCCHEARGFELALVRLRALVLERGIERAIPSHGDILSGRERILEAIDLDAAVMAAMRSALQLACERTSEESVLLAEALSAADRCRGRTAGPLRSQDEDNARRILLEERRP